MLHYFTGKQSWNLKPSNIDRRHKMKIYRMTWTKTITCLNLQVTRFGILDNVIIYF